MSSYKKERDEAAIRELLVLGEPIHTPMRIGFVYGADWGYRRGLEAASEHLLRLAERTDAGHTQGIGVALVRAAREILELGKGEL